MKKEEVDFLGLKKIKEGKSSKQIKDEIESIESFQKKIKYNEKSYIKQSEEIERLKDEINKLQKKLMNVELGDTLTRYPTIKEASRIITLITDSPSTKNKLIQTSTLTREKVDVIVSFILKHKIIKEQTKNGIKYYERM